MFLKIERFIIFNPLVKVEEIEDVASKHEGSQRFKIRKDERVTRLLEERDLDIWGANHTFYDVLVGKDKLNDVRQFLYKHDVRYSIVDRNIAETIRKYGMSNSTEDKRTLKESYIPTFTCYQTVEEIHNYLDSLARSYPNIASVGIMGHSIEGRPLKFIKISSGKYNAKVFFIDGGIHAREWVAHAAATYVIKQLVENRRELPPEMLDMDFFVVPILNPDGYVYTYTHDRLWRKNRSKNGKCYGVDINRNFDIGFGGKGTSSNPCQEIYRGPSATSEMEAQAFVKFMSNIKENLKGYVTLHSYGQFVLIPYGYKENTFPPDFQELRRVGINAALAIKEIGNKKYTVGNTAKVLYTAAGGSDDWVKAKIGANYVYTIELRDEGDYGFTLPENLIIPTVKEAFEAIKVIAIAAYRSQRKRNQNWNWFN
ncbi:carboxypeptidase B isoform X2 [Halyomorpha halys]|uniref:carboxypeptidase B isoform X2 n=1 Tax=Halyomorpha halys TaxID=286706 RepID=UPI0006D4D0B4|nr:carboxypeptidase B-like [Halyomorpha halys]